MYRQDKEPEHVESFGDRCLSAVATGLCKITYAGVPIGHTVASVQVNIEGDTARATVSLHETSLRVIDGLETGEHRLLSIEPLAEGPEFGVHFWQAKIASRDRESSERTFDCVPDESSGGLGLTGKLPYPNCTQPVPL